ncbi:ATPase [Evansella clarkii]|uniref:ATPase n=1 Tax=Evansella clarkii TaxID=79879 RepID=UPI000B444AA2|nr:ATPase [Evansella clarkii]
MKKPFWPPLIVSIGTMVVLYLIGFFTETKSLSLKVSLDYTEISLLPVIAGFLAGFLCSFFIRLRAR